MAIMEGKAKEKAEEYKKEREEVVGAIELGPAAAAASAAAAAAAASSAAAAG
jgi:hypothetical protein